MSQNSGITPQKPSSFAIKRRKASVNRARALEKFYNLFAKGLVIFGGFCTRLIGINRLSKPLLWLEKPSKKLLFDCKMCGQCVLSSTGMSCPTNCPKSIRNGPCGGVRDNGHCEVEPDMPCVWVQAWQGAQKMDHNPDLLKRLQPIDHRQWGKSSWLPVIESQGAVNYDAPTLPLHTEK